MEFFASQEVWVPSVITGGFLSRECLPFWRHGGSWLEGGETPAETSEKAVVVVLEGQTKPRTLKWK